MGSRALRISGFAAAICSLWSIAAYAQIQPINNPILISMGPSMQYTPMNGAGAGVAVNLGTAAAFQLQETVPYLVGARGMVQSGGAQLSGSVSFPANDQQAAPLNNCISSGCAANATIINNTLQGSTSFALGNATFTGGGVTATGASATFTFQSIAWQGTGSAAQLVVVSPNSSTIQSAGAPAGVSVTFLAPAGAVGGTSAGSTVSLGMAAGFQLQPVPAAGSSAVTGAGSGSIQFASGALPPVQMNSCLIGRCATTLTITNSTAQGTTVYALGNAHLTSLALGQTTSVAFIYTSIQWWSFAPGSATASQTGGWNYGTGTAIK